MFLRDAIREDCPRIEAIYTHYVLHATCTMQFEPGLLSQREAWLGAHGGRFPAIVAEDESGVVGWASLSPYHPREGYALTVEDSIYVACDKRAAGVGKALLGELVRRATAYEYHAIVASISADQPASLALHERFGFQKVAHLEQIGRKFGQWIDVVFMQRLLG